MESGISTITWKDSNIEEFINKVYAEVDVMYKTVNKMKNDLSRIQETLNEFNVKIFP